MLFAGADERGFGQIIEQSVGLAVEHAVSLLDGGLADGLRQVTLAGAGWAEKQGIFVAAPESFRPISQPASVASKVRSLLSPR